MKIAKQQNSTIGPLLAPELHGVDLWISCHGYESRSIAHLKSLPIDVGRKLSVGFDFPTESTAPDVRKRIADARALLSEAGFEIPVTTDAGFEQLVRHTFSTMQFNDKPHIVVDISSMNRSRIAALMLACFESQWSSGCTLDVAYFPSSHATHKHRYEPLEYFGPCHGRIAGWPDDPDLPSSLLIGLGTEPRRADGVVEMLEPDILAVFMALGEEGAYVPEVQQENRRILEVGGLPVQYPLQDPVTTYGLLLAAAQQLASRSRLVIVPLGPKIFCAISILVALKLGPSVGVWKASAGRGVQPVDVASGGPPVLVRVGIHSGDK